MKTIIILYLFLITFANPIRIKGVVTDANNNPIENANVYESNTKTGTITSKNGNFCLLLDKNNIKLQISEKYYKDYEKSIYLKNDTTLIIILEKIEKIEKK